eukprot:m.164410 g.164410  ORF g.164410 m.164410 type:complete len:93 (-) comp24942_c0_seq1:710-988(-)
MKTVSTKHQCSRQAPTPQPSMRDWKKHITGSLGQVDDTKQDSTENEQQQQPPWNSNPVRGIILVCALDRAFKFFEPLVGQAVYFASRSCTIV